MQTVVGRAFMNNHSFGSQLILGLAQLAAHLSVIYVVVSFSWVWFGLSLAMYFLMTSFGVSITAHRFLSHNSFHLPRPFEIAGSLFFSLSLQGSTIAWTAMHREHHRHSDKTGDPHSPADGFWRTHFLSMFYTPKIKYAVNLMRDPFHHAIHRYYWPLNFTFAAALFLIAGFEAVVYLHLFPAFLCWQAIGVAKTLAHMYGYRNFKTRDDSRNIPVLGYLTFGEAWHNNHHAKPAEYSFEHRPYEVDISALVIRVGRRYLGWA
jgi:stearoyl-CoA desaturase (delta-9 desaturase)